MSAERLEQNRNKTMKRKSTRNEAAELLKVTCPKIGKAVTWIQEHLNEHEDVDVHQWYDQLWYIVIKDSRPVFGGYAECLRAGLTVDVQGDEIYWNDCTHINEPGGNCFARSNKWKTLIKNRFNIGLDRVRSAKIHWYKDCKIGNRI